jgi:UDP-glucose 4-epimerase
VLVDDSIETICAHMGLRPELAYAGGSRGWPGDSPLIYLDCSKIQALGWLPRVTIRAGLVRTLEWFDANPGVWMEVAPQKRQS